MCLSEKKNTIPESLWSKFLSLTHHIKSIRDLHIAIANTGHKAICAYQVQSPPLSKNHNQLLSSNEDAFSNAASRCIDSASTCENSLIKNDKKKIFPIRVRYCCSM